MFLYFLFSMGNIADILSFKHSKDIALEFAINPHQNTRQEKIIKP